MPTPTDLVLYEKVKKEIVAKYKPSAYRSGLLVRKYKEEYLKKHKIIMLILAVKKHQI